MSNNIQMVEIESISGTEIYIIIDHGNGEYTSMLKSTYDQQQAALSTPMVAE